MAVEEEETVEERERGVSGRVSDGLGGAGLRRMKEKELKERNGKVGVGVMKPDEVFGEVEVEEEEEEEGELAKKEEEEEEGGRGAGDEEERGTEEEGVGIAGVLGWRVDE